MFSFTFLKKYILTVFIGILIILKKFLLFSLALGKQISFKDRVLLVFLLSTSFFLVQGWRVYNIIFDPEYTYSHGVTTDDLVTFVIFKALIVLSVVLINFFNEPKLGIAIRVIGVLGLVSLYIITYFHPERVTTNPETRFTWQFYSYGVCLVFVVISSLLVMINHTQKA